MTWPQVTIAIGLLVNVIICIAAWGRFVVRTRQWPLPPIGQIYRRSGWLIATIPVVEAWVLYEGGFFG